MRIQSADVRRYLIYGICIQCASLTCYVFKGLRFGGVKINFPFADTLNPKNLGFDFFLSVLLSLLLLSPTGEKRIQTFVNDRFASDVCLFQCCIYM